MDGLNLGQYGPAMKCGHRNYFDAKKRANKEAFLLEAGRQARDYIIKCDGSPNAVAPDR